MTSRPRVLLGAGIALLVILGLALSAPYFPERFSDFRAFYCAGSAVRAHADPYREHPLDECERRVRAPALSTLRSGVAVPAPFPGYVLALFALFATLPFAAALALWMAVMAAAVATAVVLLARVTATPPAASAIALGFPALTVALPLGQITPLVLLAIVGSAAALQSRRPRLAAACALGALLEPHVGLALVLGMFAGVPRARGVLVGGCAALALLGLVVSGPLHEWEYVSAVLPAHALANLADASQFSTASFAYGAGFAAPRALVLGSLWYGAALGVGVVVALRLRARAGAAATALVPPAFAVFGGAHTHLAQLAMAIPAFMFVCSIARGTRRDIAAIMTIVAAMPWLDVAPFPLLFPAAAVLSAAFMRVMKVGRSAVLLGVASLALLIAIFGAIVREHVARGAIDAHVDGNPLAQVAWQIFVLARYTPTESWYGLAKAPTVIAFCVLLAALVGAAWDRRALAREC